MPSLFHGHIPIFPLLRTRGGRKAGDRAPSSISIPFAGGPQADEKDLYAETRDATGRLLGFSIAVGNTDVG